MAVREVRYEDVQDIHVVRDLFLEYLQSIGLDLGYQNFDEECSGLPGKYAPPKGALYVFEQDDKVIGCVGLRPLDGEGQCELKRLYVRPAARGLGAGLQLVGAVLEKARHIGYKTILLDTLDYMYAARRLYENLGFRTIPPYYESPLKSAVYYSFEL